MSADMKPERITAARPEDWGKRRFISYSMDFDTRVVLLRDGPYKDGAAALCGHSENAAKIVAGLEAQYGPRGLDQKIANFIDIDSKPFSVVSYHNAFFGQARDAFVVGAYYPALTGVCALGERILNHLVLDLRDEFKAHSSYKRIYRKKSFDGWSLAISVLDEWGVLLPDVSKRFSELGELRHRSIHFNAETYVSVRDDALTAILDLRTIIERQFGCFGRQPWFIEGTEGHQFFKREYEINPFVKRFLLPPAPFVGPHFAIRFAPNAQALFYDRADYGPGEWSDEEFKDAYMSRKPTDVVDPDG